MQAAWMDEVARYYDANTRRFLRLGGGGQLAAIHRPIWAPGVQTAGQAFLYLNQLVAEMVRPALAGCGPAGHVLDIGCGVGGTALWLAQELGVQVTGVTNSPLQARLAGERAQRLAQVGCRFLVGDFHALPALGPLDAAYAIEAFVHARQASIFFEQAAAQLKPGGRLVVCDDFLAAGPEETPAPGRAWLRRFQKNWHVHTLVTPQQAAAAAQQAGLALVEVRDLTPHLRSFAPPLLAGMKLLTRLPLPGAYWQNLAGGTALQVCVEQGWTRYCAMLWEFVL